MELHRRLKKLRLEKNLLQKDVAKYLNVTQGGYAFYERGERSPDPDTLDKLAKFYNVSVDYILGKTNNPNQFEDKQNTIKMILDDDTEVYFYDKSKVTPEKLEIMQQIYNIVFNVDKNKK